jgi:hypothetical protein
MRQLAGFSDLAATNAHALLLANVFNILPFPLMRLLVKFLGLTMGTYPLLLARAHEKLPFTPLMRLLAKLLGLTMGAYPLLLARAYENLPLTPLMLTKLALNRLYYAHLFSYAITGAPGDCSSESPNELRIDVAVRANAEARFNAPPHQSELNGRSLPA